MEKGLAKTTTLTTPLSPLDSPLNIPPSAHQFGAKPSITPRTNLVKPKKTTKSKRLKILISETQFKALANNVLNEQEQKTIKNTHLIKIKPNENKS